jgi:hypothetical protein
VCGLDWIGPATADPGGQAVATPVCGLRYTTPASELTPPKCSMDCPGEEQQHGMTSPAAGSTEARAAGQRGVPTGASSGCWAQRALGRARGALSVAIVSVGTTAARRRGWNPTRAGRGSAKGTACPGVCTRVRLLLPEHRVGIATGRRRGAWRSPARRHGRRRARRPRSAYERVCVRGSVR